MDLTLPTSYNEIILHIYTQFITMINTPNVVNQPLREKLEAWRAQKQHLHPSDGSLSVPSASKAAPGAWCRSVPAVRRNNLILKASGSVKNVTRSFERGQNENFEDGENDQINCADTSTVLKVSKEDKDQNKDKEIKLLKQENKVMTAKLKVVTAACNEAVSRGLVAMEEVAAAAFLNDVLQQKNLELDCKISSERMNINENASEKSRKHKIELEKLREEKYNYEKRADELIMQMNEQMQQLQTMAMDRIADLEQQLMDEQIKSSQLEQTVSDLKLKLRSKAAKEMDEDDDDDSSTCSSNDTVNKSDEDN